jgi:hypothetical protein
MDKKDLKMYAAPEMEIVGLMIESQLLSGSPLGPDESALPNPEENIED